jgi:hypothetical protein
MGAAAEVVMKMTYSRTLSNSAGAAADKLDKIVRATFGDGTGSNQIQIPWSDDDAATTTPTSLDLNALPAPDGNKSLSRVKGCLVINDDSAQSLKVGGGTNPTAFTPAEITLEPGGALLLLSPAAGWTVTNGASDILKLEAVSGTADYVIALIGY